MNDLATSYNYSNDLSPLILISNLSTFNKRMVSDKIFKATTSVVYLVGMPNMRLDLKSWLPHTIINTDFNYLYVYHEGKHACMQFAMVL